MFPYWILLSVVATGAVQYRFNRETRLQGGPLLQAACILIAIIIGLRYHVGGDWTQYGRIYRAIAHSAFFDALREPTSDPGYSLLNWIGARLGFGIWFPNLTCACIFMWGLIRFSRRQPNPWLAIVIAVPYLVIVVAMGYTRQGVAIGLLLAGLASLDKGVWRFILYVFLAAAFHKSAVVVAPLVALSASHRRVVTAGILLVSAALFYYVFVQSAVDRLVASYVDAEYASQGATIRVAMNIPAAALFLLMPRRFAATDQETKLWRNFALAAFFALLMLAFTTATTAVDRIALYLIPLQLFVLSRAPLAFNVKGKPSLAVTLLLILYSSGIQFVWLNYAANAPEWVPYRFYPTAAEISDEEDS